MTVPVPADVISRLKAVLGEGGYSVLATFDGAALRDVRYERLFDGVSGAGDKSDLEQAYRVVADDFVSLEDGTGIVHIAPAYGDLEIGRKYNLPTLFSGFFAGLAVNTLFEQISGELLQARYENARYASIKEACRLILRDEARHIQNQVRACCRQAPRCENTGNGCAGADCRPTSPCCESVRWRWPGSPRRSADDSA